MTDAHYGLLIGIIVGMAFLSSAGIIYLAFSKKSQKNRRSYILEFSESGEKKIRDLQANFGIDARSAINFGIVLLERLVSGVREGKAIALIDKGTGEYVEISFPKLEDNLLVHSVWPQKDSEKKQRKP